MMSKPSKLQAVNKPDADADPLSAATRLDPVDLRHHSHLVQELHDEEVARQARIASWTKYLVHTYRLGAKDQVTPDGVIIRAPEDPSC